MNGPLRRLRGLVAGALGASSPLVLARLLSAVLTFGLPLALVRLLSPSAFGAYKQFFLVVTTVLLVGQLGLTQSLYYFLPRGGRDRGSWLAQVLLLLWPLAALVGVALHALAPKLAGPPLPLALCAALMLAASPLEAALTSDGRIGAAAVSYVLNDALRAAALVAAARWGGSPQAIFRAAAAVAALRLTALVILLQRRVLPVAAPARARLREQLRFALPFAGASLLYVGQRYCAQYVVSARFDAATFALFTVAAFHLPVVDIVFTPITEVMMVQLGRTLGRDDAAARASFADAAGKLASILFPAACGAWLLGPVVLPLLFTERYAGAVPLFLLATLEIPIWILPVDALLRAAGDTRFLFGLNAARVVITTALVLLGIRLAGLGGALVGGIASETLARAIMLLRGRRFLGAALRETLDWARLLRAALAAALACAPAWAVRLVAPVGARLVVASIVVYGAVYGAAYLGLGARFTRRPRPDAAPVPSAA